MSGWLLRAVLVLAGTLGLSAAFRRPTELRYSIITIGFTVLSLIVPGGRVLTIPVSLVLVMILIFWAARRSAEREEL